MFPVTKPDQYVSATSLTSNVDTEIQDSVATMKVCRVCLAVCVKMYNMSDHKLSFMYERVTGVEIITEDKLPKSLCWECVARLSSADNFKEKALKTQWILMNKINSSGIVTIRDIESIDKVEYQLESKLGFKFYKENDADLYIFKESDKINDTFEIENYKYHEDSKENFCNINDLEINNEEEQILSTELNVIDEIDIVKNEYLEGSAEQNVSDEECKGDISHEKDEINYQNTNFVIQTFEIELNKKNKIDRAKEIGIDNLSNFSEKSDEENNVAAKEIYEQIKKSQKSLHHRVTPLNWTSEASPSGKELRVALEDIKVTWSKYNTQDSHENFIAQSSRDSVPSIAHHPQIKKELLENKNNFVENLAMNVATVSTGPVNSEIIFMQGHTESSRNVFICDICNKQFHIKSTLTRHIKQHLKMPSCAYCSYKAHDNYELKRHINYMHLTNFNCSLCSYTTNNRRNLTNHINAKHTKPNDIHCSFCSYTAYDKSSLTKHVNAVHTKTHVYNCSFCSYKTYDKRCLSRHTNVKHTKTNVYNCSLCSYKTYVKSTLTRHVRIIHTKTNVYNCSLCSYKTYDKSILNRHVNIKHIKANVYNCTFCSYSSYYKSDFKIHVNDKHTKTISYDCSLCNYKTYHPRALPNHIKSKHTNKN